ncbi:MAG: UDP-N-acetylmuramate dehydrogenase [bacterium]|nr:MAG: UDP-N-acetylmuramate dehydrogenase [bacterium]
MKTLSTALREAGFSGRLSEGEPLSQHCSLRVGGPAALYAEPEEMRDLETLLSALGERDLPWMILGGGTNVLFPDGGYPGCVVRLQGSFREFDVDEEGEVDAGAGAATQVLFAAAARIGLTGMEFAAGIPGTLGGAVRMNAGTGTGSIADVVQRIQILKGGILSWKEREELAFAYRRLTLSPGSVITRVNLKLARDDARAVLARGNRIMEGRRSSQPLELPSAGCWFLNPRDDSAGRLIEKAGLKGRRIGGAEVSAVHANFLVNVGGAASSDFIELAEEIRTAVRKKFGILLEEEVQVVQG